MNLMDQLNHFESPIYKYFTLNFWKNVPFSSQFSTLKPILELFWILRIQPKREKEKNLNLVFRHRRAFKPQPEITWIVQILSKKLRHSLFYVFWLNIGLRAYWVTSILPGANFVRLLYLNTIYGGPLCLTCERGTSEFELALSRSRLAQKSRTPFFIRSWVKLR